MRFLRATINSVLRETKVRNRGGGESSNDSITGFPGVLSF